METEGYTCPVCGWPQLEEPPYDSDGNGSYEICPCCGFEFGYDDASEGVSHDEYRARWIDSGARWFDAEMRPEGWDLRRQIAPVLPEEP